MNIFKVQTDSCSYKYPISKILVSLILILVCINRNKLISTSKRYAFIIALLCLVVVLASAMCIYISIGELGHTYANRKNAKGLSGVLELKYASVDQISDILEDNSIIEIEILKDNAIVKVGSSAECKFSSAEFYNKRFYLNDVEFITIEEFQSAFVQFMQDEEVCIFSVDGNKVTSNDSYFE